VVPFEVPPSHCIETHFTHVPSEEQKKLLAELGVQLKYKKFTPYEDAIICKNWERFSKVMIFNMKCVLGVYVPKIKMIYYITGV
jgi:hypothetical protein